MRLLNTDITYPHRLPSSALPSSCPPSYYEGKGRQTAAAIVDPQPTLSRWWEAAFWFENTTDKDVSKRSSICHWSRPSSLYSSYPSPIHHLGVVPLMCLPLCSFRYWTTSSKILNTAAGKPLPRDWFGSGAF